MITQFPAGHAGLAVRAGRALSLFTAFVAGAALTALLLPADEPDYQTQSFVARIRSLEAHISSRDKVFGEIARRERGLSLLMKSAEKNSAALETDIAKKSQKTALTRKTLAASKKRGKENEPVFPENPDDNNLVIRLDRLLAGMGVGKGKAG